MNEEPVSIAVTVEPEVYSGLTTLAESLDYDSVQEFVENVLKAMAW